MNKLLSFLLIISALGTLPGAFAFERPLKWDVLIYMQADNDLGAYAVWDLLEIENARALAKGDIRVRVLADLPGDEGYRLYQMKYHKHPNLSRRTSADGMQISQVMSEFTDVAAEETPQLEVLERVIDEGFAGTRAQHTMLVVWGHGEGASAESEQQFGGVAIDQNPKSRISIADLASTLKTQKLTHDRSFDLLVFDACLMQTIEVAYELRGLTQYMLGSTQIHSFRGLPYTEVLQQMPKSSPHQMAQSIPQLVKAISLKSKLYNDREFTMSAYNLHEMYYQFLPVFNRALGLINQQLQQTPGLKYKLKGALERMPKFLTSSRDLGLLIGVLEEQFYSTDYQGIKSSLRQSYQALSRAVVASTFGSRYYAERDAGQLVGYTKAFGIWFPFSKLNFQQRYPDFKALSFYSQSQLQEWDKFINYLY